MIFPPITEIETYRLKLRRLRMEDDADFFRFGSDPDVCRYMLWKPHRSIEETRNSIRTSLLRYGSEPYYRWGIALRETDKLIGMIQLLAFDTDNDRCSFAYMIAKDYWGNGYGPEALTAAMEFAFREMRVHKITAEHFSENRASGAAMRKAGMIRLKTVPAKYEKDGIQYDADQYEKQVY